MTPEVQDFINKLQPKEIGEEQVGDYIVAYEGFTDSCWDYLVENGISIDDTEKLLTDEWSNQFGTPIETGWRTEPAHHLEPNVLYSIYRANKTAKYRVTYYKTDSDETYTEEFENYTDADTSGTEWERIDDSNISNIEEIPSKQAAQPITGKWAIHDYDVYTIEKDIIHEEWFAQIGLPTTGRAFDRITRGKYKIYSDRVLQIIYYAFSGVLEEFEDRINTLIDEIGNQENYDTIQITKALSSSKIATKYKTVFYNMVEHDESSSIYDTEKEAEDAGKDWLKEGDYTDYTIYPIEDKQANSELTPETLTNLYNFRLEYTDETSGGYWRGPDTIYVSKNTEPINYFAANWTKNDAPDFKSKNSYPENVITAAHEIAHGLFSRNSIKGHEALKALVELGVPRDVTFESLADLGGLYLLEPDAITDTDIKAIIDEWLNEYKVGTITPVEFPKWKDNVKLKLSYEVDDPEWKDKVYVDKEDLYNSNSQHIGIIDDLDTTHNSLKSLDKFSYKMSDIMSKNLNIGLTKSDKEKVARTSKERPIYKWYITQAELLEAANSRNVSEAVADITKKEDSYIIGEILKMSDKQAITFTIEEAKEIGEVIGIDFNNIDIEEFQMGLTIELEHGTIDKETNITDDDLYTTAKIAWAHLKEIPNYYTKLKKVEALRQSKIAASEIGKGMYYHHSYKPLYELLLSVGYKLPDDWFSLTAPQIKQHIVDFATAIGNFEIIGNLAALPDRKFQKLLTKLSTERQAATDKQSFTAVRGKCQYIAILDEEASSVFLSPDLKYGDVILLKPTGNPYMVDKVESSFLILRNTWTGKDILLGREALAAKYPLATLRNKATKQADTTLFNNPWITVRQDNKGYVYYSAPEGVVLLPYKKEDSGVMYMLRSEPYVPEGEEGRIVTVVSGRRDEEDEGGSWCWWIKTAIRELEEEAGIVVTENKIEYLGEMAIGKNRVEPDILLAIDVTGLEENEPETDGTEDEAQSYNFWVDEKGLREFIRSSKDSYLATITNKFFNKDTNLSIVSMGRV